MTGTRAAASASAQPAPVADTRNRDGLTYVDWVECELNRSPPKQKGQRTRERLKLAAARLLQDVGYHALRVGDVSALAGVAEGSFYIYFNDKADVTRAVLTEFLSEFVAGRMRPAAAESAFEAIRETNRVWIALARANSGLFRCLLQFSDEDSDFGVQVQKLNRAWCERILSSVSRHHLETDQSALLLTVYLLGGMMDDILRKLVVYPDGEFQSLLAQLEATDDTVSDAASLIFLRILYADLPIPANLPTTLSKVAEILARG